MINMGEHERKPVQFISELQLNRAKLRMRQ